MEAGGPDHAPRSAIDDDQGAAGCQRLLEEHPESRLLVTVLDRVLLPDEGIGGGRVQRFPILGKQWPELHELALQDRLVGEGHPLPAERPVAASKLC